MEQRPIQSNSRPNMVSMGNDTLDRFLGGGLLHTTLNLFERNGPSSKLLDGVWNKSFAATTLAAKNNLILIDFNVIAEPDNESVYESLPMPRRVKSDVMYKDISGKSRTSQIKIAWRYANKHVSPSDSLDKMNQIDFGLSFAKEMNSTSTGSLISMKIEHAFSMKDFLLDLEQKIKEFKSKDKGLPVNIIVKNLVHPFSPIRGPNQKTMLVNLLYSLRCIARKLERGAILISYDCSQCENHSEIKQYLYNIADTVISCHSYETGQNIMAGYKNIDGTLQYLKVPKVNSFGFHFQQDLSDWGYRVTKNNRFFVIDELSLPPCDSETEDTAKKQTAAELTKIGQDRRSMEQVGPLEEFKEVARNVIAKRL